MKSIFVFLSFILVLTLSSLAQSGPDNQKVLAFYENQQFFQAAKYLETFYSEATADAKLISSIAYSYKMDRNLQKADHFYSKLYELDSLNFNAISNLAYINHRRGMYSTSMDMYNKILLIDSNYIDAYTALAGLYTSRNELTMAYAYLDKANQLQPENGDVAYELSQLCLKMKKASKADTLLTTALKYDPYNAKLLSLKAKVMDELKKFDVVIQLCTQLIELGEKASQNYSLLARA